FINEVQC
ncbi:hypothetical protein VCNHCC004A_003584B, partial [Vibrio cholerae O1 str. NHCC-004A]